MRKLSVSNKFGRVVRRVKRSLVRHSPFYQTDIGYGWALGRRGYKRVPGKAGIIQAAKTPTGKYWYSKVRAPQRKFIQPAERVRQPAPGRNWKRIKDGQFRPREVPIGPTQRDIYSYIVSQAQSKAPGVNPEAYKQLMREIKSGTAKRKDINNMIRVGIKQGLSREEIIDGVNNLARQIDRRIAIGYSAGRHPYLVSSGAGMAGAATIWGAHSLMNRKKPKQPFSSLPFPQQYEQLKRGYKPGHSGVLKIAKVNIPIRTFAIGFKGGFRGKKIRRKLPWISRQGLRVGRGAQYIYKNPIAFILASAGLIDARMMHSQLANIQNELRRKRNKR